MEKGDIPVRIDHDPSSLELARAPESFRIGADNLIRTDVFEPSPTVEGIDRLLVKSLHPVDGDDRSFFECAFGHCLLVLHLPGSLAGKEQTRG